MLCIGLNYICTTLTEQLMHSIFFLKGQTRGKARPPVLTSKQRKEKEEKERQERRTRALELLAEELSLRRKAKDDN